MLSIRHKLIFSNIFIVLFSVLVVSIPIMLLQNKNMREDIHEIADSKMTSGTTGINLFLEKPLTELSSITEYLKYHDITDEQTKPYLRSVAKADTELYSLIYVGSNVPYRDGGQMLFEPDAEVPNTEGGYDQTERFWYKEAASNSGVAYIDPYIDIITKRLVLSICKAARLNGSVRAVAGIDVTIDELGAMVDPLKISKSGKTFLLDYTGRYITNPDSSKVLNNNFFDEYPEFAADKAKITAEASFVDIDAKGKNYFAARVVSNDSHWMLVTIGPKMELFELVTHSIFLGSIVVVLAVILSGIVVFILATSIVKPITVVDKAVNEIASGNADLTKRIKSTSNDEVGNLVNGFNKFVEKLQGIITEVKSSKDNLSSVENDLQGRVSENASSITEILANIESIGKQVTNQGSAVEQTSTAVAEIAENINSLERMIETQSSGVSQASAAVEEMIGNISSVNQSVAHMASSFEELSRNTEMGVKQQQSMAEQVLQVAKQSESLGDANKAISSVASQTNLLAMNAAIEAAHAGEAGKGFSVVADEIRKLSETSSAQSKKIGAELKIIQDTIGAVVNSSRLSTESINAVNEKIQETDQLVRQIRAAMEEQQEGSKQIEDALKMMNDSTIEVKTASKEMAEGNRVILDEIHNLQETTGVIKGSMDEMSVGAQHINETGSALSDISTNVDQCVNQIGAEIDQFKV